MLEQLTSIKIDKGKISKVCAFFFDKNDFLANYFV